MSTERPLLVDSHCHIHDSEFFQDNREEAYQRSIAAGVAMVCVGTDERSSQEAVDFCVNHPGTYPVIGVNPHEAKCGWEQVGQLLINHREEVVGIGEIGLDYYYNHSPRQVQIQALEAQIQLALDYDLPISFHVREAFDDFWPIFDNFSGIRGVLHSFTDTAGNLEKGLARGLYIGINGISTFTRDKEQQQLLTALSPRYILLETDAPYLTPKPFRGKMNIPAYVGSVAEFHAHARGVPLDHFCNTTTANAVRLFGVDFGKQFPNHTGFIQ